MKRNQRRYLFIFKQWKRALPARSFTLSLHLLATRTLYPGL
jgi:hypothetical protein